MKNLPIQLLFALLVLIPFWSCQRGDVQPSVAEQATEDDRKIREYLAQHNITDYIRTQYGNYIVIDSARPDQLKVRPGDFVFVRYRGYFPGTESIAFDSNTVESASDLLRVEIGASTSRVIAGWQDGLRQLRKFEKARLFIPSGNGYGAAGKILSDGTVAIPANQNLIFDITIKNVE